MLTAAMANIDTEMSFVLPVWLTPPNKACITGVVEGTRT